MGKIKQVITCIVMYSTLYILNFMLSAHTPRFAEVTRNVSKFQQAWSNEIFYIQIESDCFKGSHSIIFGHHLPMSDIPVKFKVSPGPRHSNSMLYEYATESLRQGVVRVYGLSVWMIHNHKGENVFCRYNEYICTGRTSQWTPVCSCIVMSWC
jgi:hypothetical protein